MPPQTRREATRLSSRTACTFWIPLVTLGALALSLLLAGNAAAQTTAPPPQPAPGLEAGDTAPPPGAPPAAAPIVPIAPVPPPAAAAPAETATTAPLVLPAPPAPRHTPIYRKSWFWGAIGVVAATGLIILAVALSNADPSTPSTRLGDMRAF